MNAQQELRADIREATKGVVHVVDRAEYVRRAREGGTLDDAWQAMADLGLLGLGVGEQDGGSGEGITGPVALMEALSEAGVPPVLYLLTAFARTAIQRHGTDEQRRRFLAPTVTGQMKIAFAITEADAGTNSFAMQTFAGRDGDHYVLNGEKLYISAADNADYIMVVARTTRRRDTEDRRVGLSVLMVDRHAPGVGLTPMKIDLHSPERQFFLHLDDVNVPLDNLVGVQDDGMRTLFDALNPERLLVSAWAIGLGQHALQRGVDYVRERSPFGTPIGSYQAVQHPLARANAHLAAARVMLYAACEAFDRGEDPGANANMAKLLASEAANAAADAVIQSFGGSAFDADSDIVTLWPMIRLLRIAPINNEMILNYISERILRLPKSY